MPKYVIERNMPGVGDLTGAELQTASRTSCEVLGELGTSIQWVHSYVTDDRIYCIYIAANEELVRMHAQKAGLPANRITEVHHIIDPTTAEATAAV